MTISGFVAYVKQLWNNKPDTSTPLSAARLTHMEDGIKGNSDAIAKIAAAVVSQILNDPNKIASMAALYAVKQQVDKQNSDFTSAFSWETIKKVRFGGSSKAMYIDLYSSDINFVRLSIGYSSTNKKMQVQTYNGGTLGTVYTINADA